MGSLEKGLLTPCHSRGGGGFCPPSDLGRGGRKIQARTWVSQYERADKIAILSQSVFVMQIYVKMHVFLFFIITDKMRP